MRHCPGAHKAGERGLGQASHARGGTGEAKWRLTMVNWASVEVDVG